MPKIDRQDLSSPLDDFIRQVIDSGLASLFDPDPIVFASANEIGVRPLRRVVREQLDRLVLQRPLPRNSFLCGCLDSTQEESIEHLLAGFGVRKGSTTWISELRHVIGNTGSVSVPGNLIAEVERYLQAGQTNEVLIFHNHPYNPINTLFDNLPLPSSQDRRLLLKTRYLRPMTGFKEALGGGTLRFYLGENGYVREFRTPGILQIINKLSL